MRRIRLRFSLRTFLIAITLLAVVGGTYVSRCQQQRRAVAEIERLGGTVFYDYAYRHDDRPGESAITINAKPPDHWVTRLLGRDFRHDVVGALGYQEDHYPQHGRIFHSFGPARRETRFHKNTDQSLRSLRSLRTLRFLDLSRTAVTDAGLAELKSLKRLDKLHLTETAITDRGLEVLPQVPGLKSVSLWNTKVTVNGIRTLQDASPQLKVSHELTSEVRDGKRVQRSADNRR